MLLFIIEIGVQMQDEVGWGRKEFFFFKTYLLGAPVTVTDILALLQPLKDLGSSSLLFLKLLHLQRLTTTAGLLAQALKRLLDELDILDAKLLTDNGQVTDRVNVTLDVNDFSIVEATDHLEDGIDSTDVRQESVTQTSTSRGTTGQTSNIVDGQVGGNLGLGLVLVNQPVEALIGNDDTGLFGVDGSIREVGRVTKGGLGDGLEERRLSDVGKTNLNHGE